MQHLFQIYWGLFSFSREKSYRIKILIKSTVNSTELKVKLTFNSMLFDIILHWEKNTTIQGLSRLMFWYENSALWTVYFEPVQYQHIFLLPPQMLTNIDIIINQHHFTVVFKLLGSPILLCKYRPCSLKVCVGGFNHEPPSYCVPH